MKHCKVSIIISKIAVAIFFIFVLACIVFAPQVANFYISLLSRSGEKLFVPLLIIIYSGGGICLAVLLLMYRLLNNVDKDSIFTMKNVKLLRVLSYMCFAIAAILIAFVTLFPLGSIVSAVAALAGLILRIVKNVFEAAVVMKEENDYTI